MRDRVEAEMAGNLLHGYRRALCLPFSELGFGVSGGHRGWGISYGLSARQLTGLKAPNMTAWVGASPTSGGPG